MSSLIKVLFILSLCLDFAISAERMTWFTRSWPPVTIVEGDFKGQGTADLLIDLMQEKLPHLEHDYESRYPLSWFIRSTQQKINICYIALIRNPEREKYLYFSLPTFILPTHSVISHKDLYQNYKNHKAVSMFDLFTDRSMKGSLTVKRSYGDAIDRYLNTYRQDNRFNAEFIVESYLNETLMKVAKKRSDYTIEYPMVVKFLIESKTIPNTVKSYSLNTESDHIIAHLGCPKTPWGKRMVNEINKILIKNYQKPRYQEILAKWLDKKDQKKLLKIYNSKFQKAQKLLDN